MRTLTAALATAIGAPVTRPAFLVEIAFSVPRRMTTWQTITAFGSTWSPADVSLDGLTVDGPRVRGRLVFGNLDNVMGALVLGEGVTDKRIRIWAYDGGADTPADMVLLADAVGGAAEVTPETVSITLRAASEYLMAPRLTIGPATGITTLLPAGAVVRVAGVDYQLDRR